MDEIAVTSSGIWQFGQKTTFGPVDKALLGGKGAGLVEMARQGLPVPPGFVVPTDYCPLILNANDGQLLDSLAQAMTSKVEGMQYGELGYIPLLSVRSGARISMPGMLDTILNVGLTNTTLPFWKHRLGERAALDCYRRLIQMYGQTVKGIDPKKFQSALKETMASKYDQPEKPVSESKMSITHLAKLIGKFLVIYYDHGGVEFPQTLGEQLKGAMEAVFKSHNNPRAIAYRKEHQIPDDCYTACVIQAMVFGNRNDKSCSGVLFSRNPTTGEDTVMGEFLPNAQGEEVVSGSVTPKSLTTLPLWNAEVSQELQNLTTTLEEHYRDMVDIEFTVEDGKLYLLQVRVGKRSAQAAFKIAYDLVKVGMITKEEALKRVTGHQYSTLLKPVIDQSFKTVPIAVGLPGSKGIATGKVWFTSEKAQKNPGGILVSKETTPDDFPGMAASLGILTQTGGATSHAAVVARSMERACVVGCTEMVIQNSVAKFGEGKLVAEGDEITIDGATGRVWVGKVPTVGGQVPGFVGEMIDWGAQSVGLVKYDIVQDALPEEGEVYLSCLKVKNAAQLNELLEKIRCQHPKLRGLLSFVDETSVLFDDQAFLKGVGSPKVWKVKTNLEALKFFEVLMSLDWVKFAENWTLLGVPESVCVHQAWKQYRKLKTLGELIEHNGYYELDDVLKAWMVKQGVKLEKFMTLLGKAGQKLTQFTVPISRDQLAYKVFGK